jgi:NAD+ synthase
VDKVLCRLVDQRWEVNDLIAEGRFDETFLRAVVRRIQTSQYKRRLPVIAKISSRTIDRDFRYARDWGR